MALCHPRIDTRSSVSGASVARSLPSPRPQADSSTFISSLQTTFKSRHDRSDLLLELSTSYLLVGLCDSRFAGKAHFHGQKVVYSFEHPVHRQVVMHMRYADMLNVRTAERGGGSAAARPSAPELRFRIRNQLAYFTREYDATNPAHELRIGFRSEADLHKLTELVLPTIRELAAG